MQLLGLNKVQRWPIKGSATVTSCRAHKGTFFLHFFSESVALRWSCGIIGLIFLIKCIKRS